MFQKILLALIIAPATLSCVDAQEKPVDCVTWKTYTDTVWVEQDITENRVINETTYETKEVTKSRPRYISEKLERTITEEKPVEKTSERTVTRTVRKPVTTRKSRIKTRVEESFEDVTEMREETYTVRKPVTETVMEKKQVLVRKPVTRRSVKKENVTVYRPQESTQTNLIQGTLVVPGQPYTSRPRARWLQRGYYTDPQTGQQVWRRSGLHWVDQPSQQAVPVVIPQQSRSVSLVPQTIVEEKPVEETTFVDEYETREVPVEVERVVEETRTRKVPYTVRVPKRKVIKEEIPYTETTYVDETITEKVPYTETVMQTVTRKEPYTRIKNTWEDYTEKIRIPKTTTKRVPYVAKYRVPYLVEVRVPLDEHGRPVARGQQVSGTHRPHPNWRKMMTKVAGAKESIKTTTETSVLEKKKSDTRPALFNIPESDAVEEIEQSVMVSKTETKSPTLAEAPKNLKFTESTTRMKPIVRADAPPAVIEPQETEASKALRKRIEDRFRNLGLKPSAQNEEPENVETAETAVRVFEGYPPEPAKMEFKPEPLQLNVDVPPGATQPGTLVLPAAETEVDDTIERPVDLSRPNR